MHAADAYAAGYTGLGVTVGVVDSGVYSASPEFADGRVKPLTITGTFGSDGYYFQDLRAQPQDLSPQRSFFSAGQSYRVPGTYDAAFNDPHGTHVTGTIGAARDGIGMHGVAFDANVFVTNSGTTDSGRYGRNVDYAYFKNAYGTLALAGARAINSSWGTPPAADDYGSVAGERIAYARFASRPSLLDAMGEVAKQYDIIHVIAAGNAGMDNPNARSSLPYFRPDLEKNWVTVGAAAPGQNGSTAPADLRLIFFSNRAGIDKYWYVAAPGVDILSTAPVYTRGAAWAPGNWNINPNAQTGYTVASGTSMAAPHATGALAVIMQRFPYMTNEQTRDVLLTTAFHRNAVDGVPDTNPNAPNAVWGWGVIDLAKAMKGPGQFLGPVAVNLPGGTRDTWSNDISEDALIQRKQENDAEAAAWALRKAAPDPKRQPDALQASIPAARTALSAVARAMRSGSQSAFLDALKVTDADPVAHAVLTTFVNAYGYSAFWPLTSGPYASARVFLGGRLAGYLAGLTDADYGAVVADVAQDWPTEVQVETTRIASFASFPTRGSLIKLGAGTLTLSGTNTFSGGVTFAGGILSVSRDASLGAGGSPLTFDGGTLQITGTAFTSTARPITWGQNGGGLDIADPANTFTLAQSLTGTGGLTKAGPGTLTLAGTNTYTGATTIAAGTLLAQGGQAIGDLSSVTIATGATLALADSETIGSLAGQGRVALGAARLTAGTNGTSTTFAGTLDGTGGLTKIGSGTLELSGTNTYAGGTSVYGGTLAVSRNANLGADSASLTLGGGGRLGVLADGFSTARPITLDGTGGLRIDLGSATFAGVIADGTQPGFLLKDGSGTAILTATNTYTGGTTVADGTLALTATGRLVSQVSVGQGGRFVNAGLAAGSVTNAGILSNTGTIAGGIRNAALAYAENASTITGGLSNAGTVLNSGTIMGGAGNSGRLFNSGTLAGGLTNTGTVTASAGRIDGAIRNDAGTLAVTGTVASDGTFANAPGATLAVTGTGAYSLAGPLTNAGTVAVAQNASLTAPAGLSNAGLVASDGILNTDLTNTGTARLSGQLNGALVNTGNLLVTGPLAGLTSLTNAGPLDLGGSALTLANLTGPASGVVGNGALTVSGSADSTYAGAILESAAPTSLTKAGSGTLKITGAGRFSGPTTIQAGTLSLNGFWTSPVAVAAAGTLRGIGTVAAPLTVAGALRPGNSPGTLTVLGPVAFAPGSRFGLDIDGPGTGTGAGSYARLLALGPSGAVAANGTLVPVLRGLTGNATNGFTPALGQRFGVLAAQAGLTGSFAGLAQPEIGLPAGTRFDALYRATGLDLVVTPSAYGDLAGLGLSQTGNARAVGAALDIARPAAGTRPDADRARVYDALYAAGPATLPGGLASLSGQAYGDAVMADLAARRLTADTIDRHLRGQGAGAASFSAGEPGLGPNRSALQLRGAAGAPDQPLASGEGRIWAEALYGFGSRAGDRAAAGADLDAGGLLLGVDRQVGADTLVGGAFSYLREGGTSRGAGLGRFTTDSYGGTLYAGTRLGAVILRGTAGLSYADGRIDRTEALGSAVSRASGLASGWDAGVSGFAGYALATGLPVELVPEVGFSYDRRTRARVAERGGLARQSFATADLNAARALVGGRLASLALEGTAALRLEGRAYWAHELGDTFATVRSSLFGVPFASRTSALGRDGAVLGVSLTGPVAEGVQLSLNYTGEVRPGASAQVISAGLQARW
ncbi:MULTISPECIES: S8 family peptidase [unclassified Methylobacterium]|uniref:S8 family peptidase n=1 Tax=unclassified Methylobacterium TaxID=2615210 RepID=UPI00136A1EF1|nr:S8 family serine peptidase [Methylobacterium sp. 2A]